LIYVDNIFSKHLNSIKVLENDVKKKHQLLLNEGLYKWVPDKHFHKKIEKVRNDDLNIKLRYCDMDKYF
jgi:hypothetical protein